MAADRNFVFSSGAGTRLGSPEASLRGVESLLRRPNVHIEFDFSVLSRHFQYQAAGCCGLVLFRQVADDWLALHVWRGFPALDMDLILARHNSVFGTSLGVIVSVLIEQPKPGPGVVTLRRLKRLKVNRAVGWHLIAVKCNPSRDRDDLDAAAATGQPRHVQSR